MSGQRAPAVSFFDRTKHFARHLPHKISQPARTTAIILWLHAHDDGTDIYLSVDTLMSMTALPRRAQFRALKELLAAGYLMEDGWKVYSNTLRTRRRRLNLAKMQEDRAAEIAAAALAERGDTSVTAVGGQGDTEGFESDTSVTRGGVTSVTKTFPLEPTNKPPQNTPAARGASWMLPKEDRPPATLFGDPDRPRAKSEPPKKLSKKAANDALDLDALRATWDRICGPTMGTVKFFNDTRQRALRGRMAEFFDNDAAKWEAFCRKMALSRYLTGQVNDFRATFDWALKPANTVKIIEGNYNRDQPSQQSTYNPHLRPGDPGWRPSPGTI